MSHLRRCSRPAPRGQAGSGRCLPSRFLGGEQTQSRCDPGRDFRHTGSARHARVGSGSGSSHTAQGCCHGVLGVEAAPSVKGVVCCAL
jgi:hypothetical protein